MTAMEQDDLLRFAIEILERMKLPYVVTGSMASIMFGEPRLTNDIDIVVRLPASQVKEFCRQFPEDQFYVSEDAARDAVRMQRRLSRPNMPSALIHGKRLF